MIARIKKAVYGWACWVGWHVPVMHGFDGASTQAHCKRCGYVGLIDSQGNLF